MRMFSKPVEKLFEVVDETYGDWSITVAQATEATFEALSDTEATARYVYKDGEFSGMERDRNLRKRLKVIAYHTLVQATGFTNDDGVEQFKAKTGENGLLRVSNAMSLTEFSAVWGLLPSSIVDRIGEMIYDVNPSLAPNA